MLTANLNHWKDHKGDCVSRTEHEQLPTTPWEKRIHLWLFSTYISPRVIHQAKTRFFLNGEVLRLLRTNYSQKKKKTRKKILPFVSTYQPLMWHLKTYRWITTRTRGRGGGGSSLCHHDFSAGQFLTVRSFLKFRPYIIYQALHHYLEKMFESVFRGL